MDNKRWTTVIEPKTRWFDINIRELWNYKDLIFLFVKRNFATLYKQTVLGPLWVIINPLLTTIMFTIVFGKIAKISTDGVPQILFYMAGNTLWIYFSYCITQTSTTFTANAGVFGKVYFPRLITPLSTVITGFANFLIQFTMFLCFMGYFSFTSGIVHPNTWMLITPILILEIALLGLGFGIIISSLTTKYRDLAVLVGFGVQLWMYVTPIVYPASQLSVRGQAIIMLNPMTPIIETFKYAFLGCGAPQPLYLLISGIITIIVLLIGIILFNRIEKTFMDTV